MPKKRSPRRPGKESGESYVGRKFGRRRTVSFQEHITHLASPDGQGAGFDRFARSAEKWAKETLERAGLPSDQGGYRIADGKPLPWEEIREKVNRRLAGKKGKGSEIGDGFGDRMAVVEARGFRKFESDEWRAAALLDCLDSIRRSEQRGDAKGARIYAVRAGDLFREKQIHDLFVEDAKKKKARKPDPVISRWVATRRRVKPDLTLAELEDQLHKTDDAETIVVGKAEIYLEGDRIMVSRTRGGEFEDVISIKSLPRYLTKAREERKAR